MFSAVLDTNVLASGTLSAFSPPGQILNAWRKQEFELVISTHIVTELRSTFEKPYFQHRLKKEAVTSFFSLLENEARITSITVRVRGVATHREDDMILATAVSAKADYLVTGDTKLRKKIGTSYKGISLATPEDFLQVLKR